MSYDFPFVNFFTPFQIKQKLIKKFINNEVINMQDDQMLIYNSTEQNLLIQDLLSNQKSQITLSIEKPIKMLTSEDIVYFIYDQSSHIIKLNSQQILSTLIIQEKVCKIDQNIFVTESLNVYKLSFIDSQLQIDKLLTLDSPIVQLQVRGELLLISTRTLTYFLNINQPQDINIIGSKPRKNTINGSCFYSDNQILSLRPNKKLFIYNIPDKVVMTTVKYLVDSDDIPDFQYIFTDKQQNIYTISEEDQQIYINQIDLQANIINKYVLQGEIIQFNEQGIYYIQDQQLFLFSEQEMIEQQIQDTRQQEEIIEEEVINQEEQSEEKQQKIEYDSIDDLDIDFIEEDKIITEQSNIYEEIPISSQQLPLNVTPLNILFQQQTDEQLYDSSLLSIACKQLRQGLQKLYQYQVVPNENSNYFDNLLLQDEKKILLQEFYQQNFTYCQQIVTLSSTKDSLYEKAVNIIKTYISYCFTTLSVFQQIDIQLYVSQTTTNQQLDSINVFLSKMKKIDPETKEFILQLVNNSQELLYPQVFYFLAFIFNIPEISGEIQYIQQEKSINGKLTQILSQKIKWEQFSEQTEKELLTYFLQQEIELSEYSQQIIKTLEKIKQGIQQYADYYLQSYLLNEQSTQNWNIIALYLSDNILLKYSIVLELYQQQKDKQLKQQLLHYINDQNIINQVSNNLSEHSEPILTNALQNNIIEYSLVQCIFTNLVKLNMQPQIIQFLLKFNSYNVTLDLLQQNQNIQNEIKLKAFKQFIQTNESEKILADFILNQIINQKNLNEYISVSKNYIEQDQLLFIINQQFTMTPSILKSIFE